MDNTDQNTLPRLIEIIKKGNSGTIVLPQNPSSDAVAAACALYLGLHKMGKSVSIACSTSVDLNLTGADKIQPQLINSGDNLVISFPYSEGAIDKVDYNIQGENFNLIITPRPGFPKIEEKQVKYSYTGGNFDFIIVMDSPTLNALGPIYTDNQKQFQGKDIINIDRHLTNSFYGTVNLVNKTSSSISEMVLKLMQELRVELDRDIATNLYAGVASATNNFTSYSVNADTFEVVATLLRLGAVKKTLTKPPQRGFNPNPAASFNPPPPQPMSFNQPPMNTPFNGGSFEEDPDMITPIQDVEKGPSGSPAQTPQDWLKPKIFRGGGGLT